jgi:hypothetical protein
MADHLNTGKVCLVPDFKCPFFRFSNKERLTTAVQLQELTVIFYAQQNKIDTHTSKT